MECTLTGQQLPPRPKGQPGAPKLYISPKATRCNHRLAEVETLLMELQASPGFTSVAAARVRARVFRIGNMVKTSGLVVPAGPTTPFGIRLRQPIIDWLDTQAGTSRSSKIAEILEAIAGL